MLRGELDWIVLKALEKDRGRRYETANAFARDIERYLKDETVEACPPSAGYRLRKFARKYRAPLAVASGFALLLIAGASPAPGRRSGRRRPNAKPCSGATPPHGPSRLPRQNVTSRPWPGGIPR